MTHAIRALQSHGLSGGGINFGSIHTFLTTQIHGRPPRIRDQLNAGGTSETTRMWKTIHTIHYSKANMKGWIWRPNYIRGPCGPKASWHLSSGNLSRPRIESEPTAWQARMLPPAPQQWTIERSRRTKTTRNSSELWKMWGMDKLVENTQNLATGLQHVVTEATAESALLASCVRARSYRKQLATATQRKL